MGVNKYYNDMYNKNGVSAIIINTEKGNNIFNNIKNKIIYKECKIEEILDNNAALKCSSKKNINREKFFKDLDKLEFKKIYNKYKPKNRNLFVRIFIKLKSILKITKLNKN